MYLDLNSILFKMVPMIKMYCVYWGLFSKVNNSIILCHSSIVYTSATWSFSRDCEIRPLYLHPPVTLFPGTPASFLECPASVYCSIWAARVLPCPTAAAVRTIATTCGEYLLVNVEWDPYQASFCGLFQPYCLIEVMLKVHFLCKN